MRRWAILYLLFAELTDNTAGNPSWDRRLRYSYMRFNHTRGSWKRYNFWFPVDVSSMFFTWDRRSQKVIFAVFYYWTCGVNAQFRAPSNRTKKYSQHHVKTTCKSLIIQYFPEAEYVEPTFLGSEPEDWRELRIFPLVMWLSFEIWRRVQMRVYTYERGSDPTKLTLLKAL